jgi:hypothetical protein
MELKYRKLISDEKLEIGELPRAAQVGINQLTQIETGIRLTKRRGHKVTDYVIEKVEINDKWVVQEILSYLETKRATPKEQEHSPLTTEVDKTQNIENSLHKHNKQILFLILIIAVGTSVSMLYYLILIWKLFYNC